MNADKCAPAIQGPAPLCFAKLFKTAFDGGDLRPLRDRLIAQSHSNAFARAAALMSLCVVEQILGDKAAGLARQAEALAFHRLYQSSWPSSRSALRVLAFKAAGDIAANTPIEFLLEGSDVVLYSLYVVPGQPLPEVPAHDIAIVTVGESDGDRPVMREIERLIENWPCPVLNRPDRVLQLSREGMYNLLRGVPGLFMPATVRIDRADLENIGRGLLSIGQFLEAQRARMRAAKQGRNSQDLRAARLTPCPFCACSSRAQRARMRAAKQGRNSQDLRAARPAPGPFCACSSKDTAFPLIARPIGSHAGRGLAKLDGPGAIDAYLAAQPDAEFFLSPYVEYRSADGQFRKYRLVWIDGRPYPCHMAISDQWKVWYYNADMAGSPAKRAEEEEFMSAFDDGFGRRHAAVLAAMAERFGLEYVGIDCAELPDGRLIAFEGDISLVVHDMDPPGLYPYKSRPTQQLFAAFRDMLKRKSLLGPIAARG